MIVDVDEEISSLPQSFAPRTLRKSLASRAAASANSRLSSRNASNSQKTPYPSTLLRSRTVVSRLLLNANLSGTNFSTVLLCEELAMASCVSSWRVVPKAAKSLFPESSGLLALRA